MPRRTVCGLLVLLIASPALPQALPIIGEFQGELAAPDATSDSAFGTAVRISGDRAVVGDPFPMSPAGAAAGGEVYVFVRNGAEWFDDATLTASEGSPDDEFGRAVDVSGESILVGASADDVDSLVNAGSAHVFARDSSSGAWSRQAFLKPDDAVAFDRFGFAVGLDEDAAVVGAPAIHRGSAYVFTRESGTWAQQARLTANDAAPQDDFGASVAVRGDTIVVGAPLADEAGVTRSGAAYVFVRHGGVWRQDAKLVAAEPVEDALFGSSVAIDGDVIVVGSPHAMTGDISDMGSADVFVLLDSVWTLDTHLAPAGLLFGSSFGTAVAISGEVVVVGADRDIGNGGASAGSARVFVQSASGWNEALKLTSPDGASFDHFGDSVSIDGSSVLVGAGSASATNPPDSGSAYLFELVSIGVWENLGLGLAGTSGTPNLTGFGTILPGSPILLLLTQAMPASPALLFAGLTELHAPFKGGTLVPSPDVTFAQFTFITGNVLLEGAWPAALPSGATLYFQWWIADPGGPAGLAASNALSATNP